MPILMFPPEEADAAAINLLWRYRMAKSIKSIVNKFIHKLAEGNEKSFGSEKLGRLKKKINKSILTTDSMDFSG